MRHIYLVRHGRTVANDARVVQTEADPLDAQGILQAQRLAERFERIPFDVLVASDLPRAMDTAAHIGDATRKELLTTPLLRETPYPSQLHGLSSDSDEVGAYYTARLENIHNPDFRFGDEETFNEIKERIQKAWEYIRSLEGDVVAVAHGNTIRHMVCYALFDGALTAELQLKAMPRLLTSNTGITLFKETERGMGILTWNDHAHLG